MQHQDDSKIDYDLENLIQSDKTISIGIFCSSRRASKEPAGLKIYVLAISQDFLKSINKLPLNIN